MKSRVIDVALMALAIPLLLLVQACSSVKGDTPDGAPPPAKVVPFPDAALFSVDHPDQFPLAVATEHPSTSELVVTGTVTPDVSRNVPVVSLAS
jgi:cobalt-zinc-cadmium efflux system membrane fusion protein